MIYIPSNRRNNQRVSSHRCQTVREMGVEGVWGQPERHVDGVILAYGGLESRHGWTVRLREDLLGPNKKALQARSCPHTRRSGDSSLCTDTRSRKCGSTRGSPLFQLPELRWGRFPVGPADHKKQKKNSVVCANLLTLTLILKNTTKKGTKNKGRIYNLL